MGDEHIVLLDAAGAAIGTAPKAASHHRDTPYHLAFSCYLVDEEGRVLITRRALDKATFPGVWTNSCCGHPGPREGLRAAVCRRLRTELGIAADPAGLTLLLPDFEYRAVAADGVVEHERCPVVRAAVSGAAAAALRPDPAEVAAARWHSWQECRELADHPDASPWFRMQLARLSRMGTPLTWPDASAELLPPAVAW